MVRCVSISTLLVGFGAVSARKNLRRRNGESLRNIDDATFLDPHYVASEGKGEQNEAPSITFPQDQLISKSVGEEYFATEEHKYFAITMYKEGISHHRGECGATMIGRRWAITAAHCASNLENNDLIDKLDSLYINPVGPWTQKDGKTNDGFPFQIKEIKTVHEHPFHKPGPASSYDIALLELVDDVHSYIETVPIADCSYVDSLIPGTNLEVLGMGQADFDGPKATHLKEVFVPLVGNDQCVISYREKRWDIDNTMICAGGEGTSDSCRGDSGGPLLHNGILIGSVSWGHRCAEKRYPWVYAKTCELLDWIKGFEIEGIVII